MHEALYIPRSPHCRHGCCLLMLIVHCVYPPPPANDWIRNKGLAFYRWIFPNSLSIKNAGIRADDVPDSPFTWEDALVFPTTPCSSICFIWLWTHGIMSCIMFEVDFILRSLRLEDTSYVRSKHKRSGITFMRLNVISIQYL